MRPFRELTTLHVRLDKLFYAPDLDSPEDRPHPFAYFITIENLSEETITIKGRKWVLSQSDGKQIVVEGDGVVGRFPELAPGESFSYNSYHVVACDSMAQGAFFAISDQGEPLIARIPTFQMQIP